MCTSFVHRGSDLIIAMNFDNNGMKYALKMQNNRFIVYVDGGRGYYPSFGLNGSRIFANNLLVDSNGKGLYKRPAKDRTHTSKLITDLFDGVIPAGEIDEYLCRTEVVNTPDFSTHVMICDNNGNGYVVEPGRGIIRNPANESSSFILSNFSLYDYHETGILAGSGSERYQIAENLLQNSAELSVEHAFEILDAVKQTQGEWRTAFSFVYSRNQAAVTYCVDGNFTNLQSYYFAS
jgi:hypothetical protein